MKVRIVLVEDEQMLRHGLRLILQSHEGFEILGEAENGAATIEMVAALRPDLVVQDLHLPDRDGISIIKELLPQFPAVRFLMLSADSDVAQINAALLAGASGYLLKHNSPEELVRAITTIMEGLNYLCPVAATALVQELRANPRAQAKAAGPSLSERELQVLRLLGEGLRNKEMAVRLGISAKSVETYRSRLLTKLKCGSVAELIRYAIREGITSA